MNPLIEQYRNDILALARAHGVVNVRVFGSMARGDADETSDIDLLVDPLPETSLFDLGGLLADIEDLTQRKVDLVSGRAIAPALRQRILDEAVAL